MQWTKHLGQMINQATAGIILYPVIMGMTSNLPAIHHGKLGGIQQKKDLKDKKKFCLILVSKGIVSIQSIKKQS